MLIQDVSRCRLLDRQAGARPGHETLELINEAQDAALWVISSACAFAAATVLQSCSLGRTPGPFGSTAGRTVLKRRGADRRRGRPGVPVLLAGLLDRLREGGDGTDLRQPVTQEVSSDNDRIPSCGTPVKSVASASPSGSTPVTP